MTSYATFDDVNARRSPTDQLSEDMREYVETLLDDVGNEIDMLLTSHHINVEELREQVPESLTVYEARVISCNVVNRNVRASVPAGTSQYSQTAGPYSMSYTVADPTATGYLWPKEKRRLLAGYGISFSIRPHIRRGDGEEVDSW